MFSRIYGVIIETRNSLYEKSVFKSFSLGVPTISVGNLTVGGTGKTPLVAFVSEVLSESGEKVCVLTRGYGRANPNKRVLVCDGENILSDANQAGDEPVELAGKLLGKAIIVVDANRAAAGIWAREEFAITAFVLDDAFQHRKIRRDLNVVTIDATNPFGNGKLLPAGILREPLENLKRADAIVITRANLVEEKKIADLKHQILELTERCKIFVSKNQTARLINLPEFHAKTQREIDRRQAIDDYFFAFCALGNPENFFGQITREGFNLVGAQKFPDHHFYTPRDIEKIEKTARHAGGKILLTTAKDAVKLKDLNFGLPCFVAENKMDFDEETDFRRLLISAVNEARSKTDL